MMSKKHLLYPIVAILGLVAWPISIPGLAIYYSNKSNMESTQKMKLIGVLLFTSFFLLNFWIPILTGEAFEEFPEESILDEITIPQEEPELFEVVYVVDGDTLDVSLDGETQRVRLIGLNTPEIGPNPECFGVEASGRLRDFVEDGFVYLEMDDSQGEYDKYDRLLAYLILPDGTNINKALIEEGYAREYTYDQPYKYREEFLKAQQEARLIDAGIWGDNCSCSKIVKSKQCVSCHMERITYQDWSCLEYIETKSVKGCSNTC